MKKSVKLAGHVVNSNIAVSFHMELFISREASTAEPRDGRETACT